MTARPQPAGNTGAVAGSITATAKDVWERLARPMDRADLQWRIDGKPKERDGKWYARAVCYADVPVVIKRLDEVFPGEWDFTAENLGPGLSPQGEQFVSMKGRLQILGVIREDVGIGPDPKQALTDAFKRTARLFRVALELWSMGPVWVQVDGDGKYPKMVQDPWAAFERTHRDPATTQAASRANDAKATTAPAAAPAAEQSSTSTQPAPAAPTAPAASVDNPHCPKCGGRMWDNRIGKRNPKAPDFKCRDRSCDGVIWPPKAGAAAPAEPAREPDDVLADDDDDLPF